MKYGIVTDSSCDLKALPSYHENIIYMQAPLTLRLGDKEYTDDDNLDIEKFMSEMKACTSPTGSAAPSPQSWLDAYQKADEVFAVTISGKLSASHESAVMAKNMLAETRPDKKIFIIDSLSAGPGLTMLVLKLAELMEQQLSFEEICAKITEYQRQNGLLFILESLDNLVKNGRINKIVGNVIGKLGIKLLAGASSEGTIDILHKCRGRNNVYDRLIKTMLGDGYNGGKVIISHCFNEPSASYIAQTLRQQFPASSIKIMPTGGLCSYYAEDKGIIVAYEK